MLEPEWWRLWLLMLWNHEGALAGEGRLGRLTREILEDDAGRAVHVGVGPHRLLSFVGWFDRVEEGTHVFNRRPLVGLVCCWVQTWRSEERLLKFWWLGRLPLEEPGQVKDRLQDHWFEGRIVLADLSDAFHYLSSLGGRVHVYYLLGQFFNINSDLISQHFELIFLGVLQHAQPLSHGCHLMWWGVATVPLPNARLVFVDGRLMLTVNLFICVPEPFVNLGHLQVQLAGQVADRLLGGALTAEVLVELPQGDALEHRFAVLFNFWLLGWFNKVRMFEHVFGLALF